MSAAANAGIGVRLNIGGTTRRAELVTHGATSGRGATLWFSYSVVSDDADTNGVAVTATNDGRLVLLRNGATLKDLDGRNAKVAHAGLADNASHKVNGNVAASGNSAPVYDDDDDENTDDTDHGVQLASPGAIVHWFVNVEDFRDPDGDSLNFEASVGREDVYDEIDSGLVVVGGRFVLRVRANDNCELANLRELASPHDLLTSPLDIPATITASDPDGASVQLRIILRTRFGCPFFSSATVTGSSLEVVFDDDDLNPTLRDFALGKLTADNFEVKVDGTAVPLAAANAVSVNGNMVTLALAAPVASGKQVTVSYNPGDNPGAVEFTDRSVTNETPTAVELTGVTANGRTVTLTFDQNVSAALDSTNEEPTSEDLGSAVERLSWAFVVQGAYHGGTLVRNASPTGVAVSGSTVTLTLGSDVAFLPGKDVSVSYDAEFAGRRGAVLRDANGNTVDSFARGMVANATPGTERPVVTSVQVAGTQLTLTFDKALDAASAPAGSRFRVVVHPVDPDAESRVIGGTGTATVSSQTVTVTLASAVEQDETALAAYRKGDEANPLRDAAGTKPEVESFELIRATVMDRTAPKLHSARSSASIVWLYYNEKLDTSSTPPTSAFTVTNGGSAATVNAVSMAEDAVGLGFGRTSSGAVEVSYTVPDTNPVRDVAGNAAAAFSEQTAVNADASEAPALTGAETNGDIVTLTFDRALHGAALPAADAFEVLNLQDDQLNEDLTGDFKWGQTILSVAVRGSTVVLDVNPGLYACSPARVSYEKPATGALRNFGTKEVASFSDQDITHLNAFHCVFNAVRRASMEPGGASGNSGRRMSVQFDRSLKRSSLPDKDAFAVTPRNGGAPIEIEEIWIPDDPTRLLMTLSRPMSDGERATASYRPRSSTGLKDTDGNILAPFSAEVTTDEPAAGVTAALVSDPGDDATYAAGDTVRVRLTFFEAVEVDTTQGTPRLKLDLDRDGGSGERWAAYEGGTGTTELTFAYVASSGDMSADGVAVLADTLEPNGGAIKSVATGTAASLGHAGLDHDPAHRVDAEPPRLLRGEIDGGTMTLFFSEALDPDWTGGKFDMAVEVPEQGVTGFRAAGGVTVEGATVTVGMGEPYPRATAGLDRNSVRYFRRADGADGALRDLAGNPVQTPHRSLLHSQGGTVELRYIKIDLVNVTGTGSSVTAVAVVSDAGYDDTYALGETIRVEVTFAEPVEVDTAGGTPRLTIRMDPRWGEFWARAAPARTR